MTCVRGEVVGEDQSHLSASVFPDAVSLKYSICHDGLFGDSMSRTSSVQSLPLTFFISLVILIIW